MPPFLPGFSLGCSLVCDLLDSRPTPMTSSATTRFRAELASGTSPGSVIISGDVDAYGLEELLAAARRYATRVRVQLAGTETQAARRFVEHRLARPSRLGIEVMLACE